MKERFKFNTVGLFTHDNNKDEAFLVEGRIPHSCWNNTDGMTKMIGITVQ